VKNGITNSEDFFSSRSPSPFRPPPLFLILHHPMPESEKINFKSIPGKVEMWSDTDGISWLVFAQESEIAQEDMEEILQLVQTTLSPEDELLALADVRLMESISNDARNIAAGKEIQHIYKALAIVSDSTAMNLVAKFFIHFHKPPRPTKIFHTVEEAKAWLLTFR
jgi:hypothetical protein